MPATRLLRCLAVFVALVIAFAPALAEARAGNRSSMGSRGAKTYEFNGARPVERSVTPPPAYAPAPAAPINPGYAARPGFGGGGFMSGLAGGFIGAGLAGMLFGHGFGGPGGLGFGGVFGLLLQLLLIGFLVRLAFRWFTRNQTTVPAYPGAPLSGGGYGGGVGGAGPAPARPLPPIAITDADQRDFSALLERIQHAWSEGDIPQLAKDTTPEMLSYFAEQLAENTSRGVRNRVERVSLIEGSVVDAWQEQGRQYASARLRFSACDYLMQTPADAVRPGRIIEGSAEDPVEAEEIWTFLRAPEGRWILSAIQQI